MNREELKKGVSLRMSCMGFPGAFCEEDVQTLIDYIQSNTESKDEWVSVEDRLPEVKVKVDLFLTDGRRVCNYEIKEREQKLFWYFSGLIDIYKNSVTHWMPLPQPPNKGVNHE